MMMMKNFKFGYVFCFSTGLIIGFLIEMIIKFNGWRGFQAGWVSAITAVIGIPISLAVLWWQLHRASIDRRYDARVFFDIVQAKKIVNVKLILHSKNKIILRKAIEENSLKTERFIRISNVGNSIAQNVLIKLKYKNHAEYFYKPLLKLNDEYTLIPDYSLKEDEMPEVVEVYYLSKLGQCLRYSFNVLQSIGETTVIRASKLKNVDEELRRSGSLTIHKS